LYTTIPFMLNFAYYDLPYTLAIIMPYDIPQFFLGYSLISFKLM
jgi:hypothetical protein